MRAADHALSRYDELSRRTSEKDQAGKVTSFQYDKLSRLVKVIDANNKETSYGYDELGNRIRQTDANGRSTWFLFDKLGREVARHLPDGKTEQKTYDNAGNLETRTDFMGRVTTYDYDNNNRLTSRTYPNAAENVSFTYTNTGRRLTATDSRGTTDYGYDTRDRLTSLSQPGVGQLTYAHDGNGNRTRITAIVGADQHNTLYSYDDASRLDIVTDPATRTYNHDHDANGNRQSLLYPNGALTEYSYNSLNRLTDLKTTNSGTTIFRQQFTLGPAGNRTQIVETDDTPVATTKDYSYDNLYRLTQDKVSGSLAYQKDFTYDFVGNRKKQETVGTGAPGTPTSPGIVNYTYDERDRLTTESANNLTYDHNGNLTAKVGEALYTWDHESRLIAVQKTDGTTVGYVYDADGNRVSTTTTPNGGSATTVQYLVDTSGGLSHVVAEMEGAATPTLAALYVRGTDDLLSVMRPAVGGGWTSRFFHADGIGSIRRLTNEAGATTDGYSWTAFGERIAHTGTDPQPYAFAGEPLDPNSGFQYHRARWMDPRAGRFTAMDPFEGTEFEPASLHRHLYANASPVSVTDPSGLNSLTQQLGVISVAASVFLNSMSANLANVFRQGGPVIGQFFNNIGRYGQATGMEIIQTYQRFKPALEVFPQRVAGTGTRIIDVFLRLGDRAAWIEMKFGVPWNRGESLTRLVDQLKQALATGEGEVLLWTLKEPVARQLNLLNNALGSDAGRVRLVHGVQALGQWLIEFFGPV